MKEKEVIILVEILMNILSKYKHEITYEQGTIIEKTIELITKQYKL